LQALADNTSVAVDICCTTARF